MDKEKFLKLSAGEVMKYAQRKLESKDWDNKQFSSALNNWTKTKIKHIKSICYSIYMDKLLKQLKIAKATRVLIIGMLGTPIKDLTKAEIKAQQVMWRAVEKRQHLIK